MTCAHRSRAALAALILCFGPGGVATAPGAGPLRVYRHVVLGSRRVEMRVEDPSRARAVAVPRSVLEPARRVRARAVPRFVLTRRVLAKVRDRAALERWCASHPRLGVSAVPGLPGWVRIETASADEAITLADALCVQRWAEHVRVDTRPPITLRGDPNDPRFGFQWNLENTQDPLFDANVRPVWDAGITGAGVVIGIVEGAFQHDHPDLLANFLPEASQTGGTITTHATSVAGIAAAVGRNGLFGLGAAYGARLSNQLIGTDLETAAALAFRNDLNDVKNNSWGPADIGFAFELPAVVRDALAGAVETGRNGRGTVFVWAAGNGGTAQDRVDYDPYASSRYTIAVGAVGDQDTRPFYSERGSSLMIVAPSSGNVRNIYSVSWPDSETFSFGGTSAAAPLVSGVVALMLEANPQLSWRDVQQILIHSARQNDPADPDWLPNGAGLPVHYSYGYGAVDAAAAVALARTWTPLPHEVVADSGVIPLDLPIPDNDRRGVRVELDIPRDIRVESVELILNVQIGFIGDLQIELTSPAGTVSRLANRRDDSQRDYVDYVFTSLRHVDEHSSGVWTIKIADRATGVTGLWQDARLRIWGRPWCPGDLNEDGALDLTDLAILLERLGACEAEADGRYLPEADLDNSHCIDLTDLQIFLSRFGTSCP